MNLPRTLVAVTLTVLGGAAALASPADAATVTVAPATASDTNAFPFGSSGWAPNAGFIYKNIPAFTLAPGDTLAFDTQVVGMDSINESNIQFDVGLSPTTVNGGDIPSGPFTKVVSNTELASSPRGNATPGDFDLKYKVQAPFSFPGGGLVIRFSNPNAGFLNDATPDNLVGANSMDTSGFFVARFIQDADGLAPFDGETPGDIGGFQVVTAAAGSGGGTTGGGNGAKPVISGLSLSHTTFKAARSGGSIARKKRKVPTGTKISFSLSEAATVKFTVQRKTRGRKVSGKCKAKTRRNAKKKACTRYVTVKGSFSDNGTAGKNSLTFRGRLGGKALRPGSYRLTGTATDSSKASSVPRRKGFKIVR